MIVTTTTAIDGRTATDYVGVVTGEAVLGPTSLETSSLALGT